MVARQCLLLSVLSESSLKLTRLLLWLGFTVILDSQDNDDAVRLQIHSMKDKSVVGFLSRELSRVIADSRLE